jgi:hypothetical protein
MRVVPLIALFLYATAAHAGALHFVSKFGPPELNQVAASPSDYGPGAPQSLVRPIGLDGLAFRLGISGKSLNFYEFTSGAGTTAQSRLTVGVGSKGLLVRLVW